MTHLCTDKATGEQFACKTIAKRKLVNKEDIEDVRREVQIMHHLTGAIFLISYSFYIHLKAVLRIHMPGHECV